jgi:F420-dependent methylenetetrahydromethanopterin dehydrogenase
MISVLVDHNIEGQALLLQGYLAAEGWLTLLPMRFLTLTQVSLSIESTDREVWRFVQEQEMVLLTANRRRRGPDSLAQVIREENTLQSRPVVTISDADRVAERDYRERCASRLVEILLDLDNLLGAGRLFIP